jgi:hypothetical protein
MVCYAVLLKSMGRRIKQSVQVGFDSHPISKVTINTSWTPRLGMGWLPNKPVGGQR